MKNKTETTIILDNIVGIPENAELIICKNDKYERVSIHSIDVPVYKHKSKLHELLFNFTSKFMLFGFPQPKIIKGSLNNIKIKNDQTS